MLCYVICCFLHYIIINSQACWCWGVSKLLVLVCELSCWWCCYCCCLQLIGVEQVLIYNYPTRNNNTKVKMKSFNPHIINPDNYVKPEIPRWTYASNVPFGKCNHDSMSYYYAHSSHTEVITIMSVCTSHQPTTSQSNYPTKGSKTTETLGAPKSHF